MVRVRGQSLSVENLLASIRRHGPGAFWAAADQGINPILQLVLTPLLVARLGSQEFGLWILGITLVNMSQIVSCGAGVAATKHVSADLGAALPDQAIAAARGAVTVAALSGCCFALLLWICSPLIASTFLSAVGPAPRVASILALAGLAAAIQEIDGVYSGVLRGAERFDLGARIEIPARVCVGGLLLWLATRYTAAEPMLIGLIAGLAIKAACKGRQVVRLLAAPRSWAPFATVQSLRRVWQFGRWQWLQATGTALFASMDQLLVGGLLGAGALARYGICLQLAQYVHLVPSVLLQVIFPRVSSLGRGLEPRAANALLRSATAVGVGCSCVLGLPLILLARPVLAVWIGPAFAAENHWLLSLLVAIHIVLAVNIGAYFILLGRGESARSAKIVLSAALLQLIAAVVLAPFGLLAFAANRLVYSVGTAFLYRSAHARVADAR